MNRKYRTATGLAACVLSWNSMAQIAHHANITPTTGAPLVVFGAEQPENSLAEPEAFKHLDGALRGIVRAGAQSLPTVERLHNLNPGLHVRLAAPATTPEVLVDAVAREDGVAAQKALQELGLRDVSRVSNLVGGWLPVTALSQAANLKELVHIRASMPRTRSAAAVGPVALQGDFVQGTKALRTQYPTLDGRGLTVGIISDSFNCYQYYATNGISKTGNGYNGYAVNGFATTYADDVASGALPPNVDVVEEADCAYYGAPQQAPYSDEGRAMTQIVYAVAPGAKLAFREASSSEADFAAGITQLQQLGARIIVDDIGYPDEPFFQDGIVAQALNAAATAGVTYFSAAGNNDQHSYENTAPVFTAQSGRNLLNFDTTGATTANTLQLTIPPIAPGEFLLLNIQWDQPYVTGAPGSAGATSTLNLCIESETPDSAWIALSNGAEKQVTGRVCSGPNSVGADPLLLLGVGNPANETTTTLKETITLSVELVSGTPPGRVKFLLDDDALGASIDTFNTMSPTIQGHTNAVGAITTGAALYYQTPTCGSSPAVLEPYSSYGGNPILFDATGARLATAQTRAKPDLVGPDAVNNTFLGFQLTQSTIVNPIFDPTTGLYPTSIAQCQNNPAYPNFYGTSAAAPHLAGAAALFLQANSALAPADIRTAFTSTALPMAEGPLGSGAGFVQAEAAFNSLPTGAPLLSISPVELGAGSPATITWASYGTTSCTASGAWSGAQATSGSVTLKPTTQGTLDYSLACTGPNGTGPTSTVSLSVQSPVSHHSGGGALDLTTLLLLTGALGLRAGATFKRSRG